MRVGEKLTIIKEPHNKFDANAIAVYYKDTHIGYIPKEDNVSVGELISNDILLQSEIESINTDNNVGYSEACELVLFIDVKGTNDSSNTSELEENLLTTDRWLSLPEAWKKLFRDSVNVNRDSVNSSEFAYDNKVLNELINIETLSIDCSIQNDLERLFPLVYLPSLKTLVIKNNVYSLMPLSNLTNLTSLDLSYNEQDLSPLINLEIIIRGNRGSIIGWD